MLTFRQIKSPMALLLSLGTVSSTVAPLMLAGAAQAQSTLRDIQGHWAERCIVSLANRGIVSGYPDGTFRPNNPVTRAEYATLVGSAFPTAPRNQGPRSFRDVNSSFWAYSTIRRATETGFLSGYPDGTFQPNQNIPRAQVLVSLGNGLGYPAPPSVSTVLSRNYNDQAEIPNYARNTIAAATQNQLVVNYPNVRSLQPNRDATRAEVAAFLCQARQSALIPSQFVAGDATTGPVALVAGTNIPVRYLDGDRILIADNETAEVTLAVDADIRDRTNQILIPRGSQISGELQPRDGGSQFVASSVLINGRSYPLSATSNVITRSTTARDTNLLSLARNAVIGSAAAAGISGLVGNRTINAEKVLPGAVVGTAIETNQGRPVTSILRDGAIGALLATGAAGIIGDRTITAENVITGAASGATIGGLIDPDKQRVVIIEPETDLTLRLSQDWTAPQF